MDAVIELIDAGNPDPTARQVAQRADVAVRTVFHHFDGLGDLYYRAADRHVARFRSWIAVVPPRGPLEFRIVVIVRQRRRLFETIGPLLAASYGRVPATSALTGVLDGHRRVLRQQLATTLAPEIDSLGNLDTVLLDVLEAVSGWPQWSTLRFEARHSATQAERVMVFLVARVLGSPGGRQDGGADDQLRPGPTRASG
jgi:TetR/AcrR family transcriptional regulator, regulator of autoinduction and epiphytic fitness